MGKLNVLLRRRTMGSLIGMTAYDEITDKKKKMVLLIPQDSMNIEKLPEEIEITVNF